MVEIKNVIYIEKLNVKSEKSKIARSGKGLRSKFGRLQKSQTLVKL
ncbi:MAG: hypothetical protein ACRECH_01810 [Nitrososphaerales archaeon]